ncbi:MAG: hypothetical protein HY961_01555 [Ignavibacteriae bacterium]|nr:hypothetical protein [Ignavibacteriota bacterium]
MRCHVDGKTSSLSATSVSLKGYNKVNIRQFSTLVSVLVMGVCQSYATASDTLRSRVEYQGDGLNIIGALIDDREFFDEWQKPQMPRIESVDTFRRGDEVIPIIIFATSAKDQNGNADLTYDITIRKPDGSVYGHHDKLVIWKDAPAPMMHLVKQPVVIRLEKTDPLGIYTIHATVFENVRNQTVPIDFSFRVIEDSILSAEAMNRQLTFYYRKPNPLVLPALMRTIEKAGTLDKQSAQSPIIGFFTLAMAAAPGDSDYFAGTINTLGESKAFFSYCYSLSRNKDTVLHWNSHHPSVNDMLWGAFFASGDRRLIERLVSEMRFCDEKESIPLYLTGASARWSLCSNARQHPKVKDFLEEMKSTVPTELKAHLDEALHADPGELREQMMKDIERFKNKK